MLNILLHLLYAINNWYDKLMLFYAQHQQKNLIGLLVICYFKSNTVQMNYSSAQKSIQQKAYIEFNIPGAYIRI
jgi:hypothetical protein